MDLRDFIVTPIVLIVIYGVAYWLRPYVADRNSRPYFFPALTLKLVGAISVGIIYQFYYGGGDTFMYHTLGSRIIWNEFWDSPVVGVKLLLADGSSYEDLYTSASKIYFFRDTNSYAVIRLAALFDLLTFSTYSATAALFAVLSFVGAWMFYVTFYEQYPHLHRSIAIASFFIPSVFFWGSGVLKDTVTLACLGIATQCCFRLFIQHRYKIGWAVLLFVVLYVTYAIRVFILLAFVPSVILWIGFMNIKSVSLVLRLLVIPFVIAVILFSSYYAVLKISEDDTKYSLSRIAETARTTAYDIRYWTGRDAGSGYSLGELDGSFESMIRLAPQAITVSLFRPYLWEVKNPLMLIAAVESFIVLIFTFYVMGRGFRGLLPSLFEPNLIFCLVFSVSFAFAVGVSTFNFGTLARYKIPLLPFFVTALILILDYTNRLRKVDRLDAVE